MLIKTTLLILTLVVGLSFAQTTDELQVTDMQIATAIEDRQPVSADTVFTNIVEQLYCYTQITGAADTLTVSHIWYFEDEEKAKVDLTIKGKSWRTWSSKRVDKSWVGNWRVDVTLSDGTILKSKAFKINEAE